MKKLFSFGIFISLFVINFGYASHPCIVDHPCIEHTGIPGNNDVRVGCFMFAQDLKFDDGIKNANLLVIKFGPDSKISRVIELQNTLIKAGFLKGEATGYFGVNTLKAVKKYQKANGITPTGFVGLKTQGILRSQFCNLGDISIKPPICDYAAPPAGCNYIKGLDYSNITQCGMVLSCDKGFGL
jgi:hypothetical protein